MSLANPLAIRISTPVADNVPGRGFYQLEESALYVPVGISSNSRSYFSSLESECVRLDIDRDGRLMFIEVSAARSRWLESDEIQPPVWATPADVRWLGFRTSMPEPELLTDRSRQMLLLRFSPEFPAHNVSIAEHVYLSVDDQGAAVALFVSHIVDDLAGQEISRFKQNHPQTT